MSCLTGRIGVLIGMSFELKIISGGQTGVDCAALDTAMALRVQCGGWCVRRGGWMRREHSGAVSGEGD
jgi:hypothetical protein